MASVKLTGGPLDGEWVKAVAGNQIEQNGCVYMLQDDGVWAYHSGEPAAKPTKPTTTRRMRTSKLVDESDS